MAAVILVIGFIGMIEAVSLTAGMMDHARRQSLATQILNHEIEKLRFLSWSNGSTGINDLAAGPTTITIGNQFTTAIAASGATYTLSRSVSDVVSGSLREVTFTVTWVVTTSRLKSDGSLFTRTYTRVGSAWFGKYGLNLTYQRS